MKKKKPNKQNTSFKETALTVLDKNTDTWIQTTEFKLKRNPFDV